MCKEWMLKQRCKRENYTFPKFILNTMQTVRMPIAYAVKNTNLWGTADFFLFHSLERTFFIRKRYPVGEATNYVRLMMSYVDKSDSNGLMT